jgi:hypothetical protein
MDSGQLDRQVPRPSLLGRLLRSVLRIVVLVVVVSIAGLIVVGGLIRQPCFGSVDGPPGPRADAEHLRRDVVRLTTGFGPRNAARHPEAVDTVARFLASELATAGGDITLRPYEAQVWRGEAVRQRNVVARFGGSEGPVVVVGAHYDVAGDLPGADDNASGVAGLLELARLLGRHHPQGPVELVAYSTEEPPFFGSNQMGSAIHALDLVEDGTDVKCMLCLEMIGYFVDDPEVEGSALDLFYPRDGRFIAIVGRWQDRSLARTIKRCFRGATRLPVYSYSGPAAVGADLSDHRNYWAHGIPAVMVSDTAFLRNPNYHTAADTADTLDYDNMARVVDGVLSAVLHLSR